MLKKTLMAITSAFLEYILKNGKSGVRLFIVEIRETEFALDLENFAGIFYKLLHKIHLKDKNATEYFTRGIEKMSWDFTFDKVKFFVSTFAPFYENNHPRYSFSNDTCFVMFQPDKVFDKFGINSKNPKREEITKRVKELFLSKGFKYSLKYVRGSLKAERYLKPTDLNAPPNKMVGE